MIFIALIATANMIWAITGTPVRSPIAALAGFTCGVSWMFVYVRFSIEKSGLL